MLRSDSKTAKALLVIMGLSVLLTAGLYVYENIYDPAANLDGPKVIVPVAAMYISIFFCVLSAFYFTARFLVMLYTRFTR